MEDEMEERINLLEPTVRIEEPNYAWGTKFITYWNMPPEKKFGGAWRLVLLIELLPLIIRGIYYFSYEMEELYC